MGETTLRVQPRCHTRHDRRRPRHANAASIPDFSGIWTPPSLGFEPPVSGPGPVLNKSRLPNGASNFDKITILYHHDHQFRQVRMNQPHAAQVTSSWHGDSVGHYEGDTLVIDTVGIKVGRFDMIDRLGTPYTAALHVVERYTLLDSEAAKEAQERGQKEWPRIPSYAIDTNYKGKGMQLQFTVEDAGVFTMPWTATITYRRPLHTTWEEFVCAENVHEYYAGHAYYSDKDAAVPTADKPDF